MCRHRRWPKKPGPPVRWAGGCFLGLLTLAGLALLPRFMPPAAAQ